MTLADRADCAAAIQLMHDHRIGVQPVGGHFAPICCYAEAHWEAYVTDASDPERLLSACGATIPEAVARCLATLVEAKGGKP